MRAVAEPLGGTVILSVFSREALRQWGLHMYAGAEELVGAFDVNSSDLDAGVFKTVTGYETYWLDRDEREEALAVLGGQATRRLVAPHYEITAVDYAA